MPLRAVLQAKGRLFRRWDVLWAVQNLAQRYRTHGCYEHTNPQTCLQMLSHPTSYLSFESRVNNGRAVLQAKGRLLRRWDVLWAVQSLAQRYRTLARRRELKEKAYGAAAERALDEHEASGYRRCQEAVRRAATMEVIWLARAVCIEGPMAAGRMQNVTTLSLR